VPLYYDEFAGWVHPADAFVLLHKGDENSFWLDREHHWDARYSVIGSSPRLLDGPGLATLSDALEPQDLLELPFDFRPGVVGVLDYEGVGHFMHIDRAIVFDHDRKGFYLIGEFATADDYNLWKQAALLRIGLCGGEQAVTGCSTRGCVHPSFRFDTAMPNILRSSRRPKSSSPRGRFISCASPTASVFRLKAAR
jgi:hypothetical protein